MLSVGIVHLTCQQDDTSIYRLAAVILVILLPLTMYSRGLDIRYSGFAATILGLRLSVIFERLQVGSSVFPVSRNMVSEWKRSRYLF